MAAACRWQTPASRHGDAVKRMRFVKESCSSAQGLEHKRRRVTWPYCASMTIRNPVWGPLTYHQREEGELQAAATANRWLICWERRVQNQDAYGRPYLPHTLAGASGQVGQHPLQALPVCAWLMLGAQHLSCKRHCFDVAKVLVAVSASRHLWEPCSVVAGTR